MLRRLLLVVVVCLVYTTPALATRQRLFGWCQQGGTAVTVSGTPGSGTQRFQQTFRGCTVTIYLTGTSTTVTLYSDDAGTAQANPFTASSTTGFWSAYVDGGRFDVRFSGGGIATPFTISDYRVPNDVFDVTDFGAKCDGSTNDYTAINAAHTAATGQTNGGTVLIPGNVTGSCLINSSITFDTDVTLAFEGGGRISMAASTTGTINGVIQAPEGAHIFTGSGVIATSQGRTGTYYVNWWGAVGDGSTNNSTAIQAAITSVCGSASYGSPISQSTIGAHGSLVFPPGVYVITTGLTVPPGCWADISGVSTKGTYIFQNGGSTAAIQIQGSECIACSAPPRTSSNNDAEVHLHDMSIGSTTGHALQLLRAYRTKISRVDLYSADVASNYLDLDGVSTFTGIDIRTAGNDSFPYGQYTALWCPGAVCGDAFEFGLRGVYITVRAGPTAGDYNLSGEIHFEGLWVQGQQTQDAVYVDIPTATDFNVFPVVIDRGDFVIPSTYAGVRANGQTIVTVNNSYCEAGSGTVDCLRVDSSQGNATTLESAMIIGTDNLGPGTRLNLNGDGTRKPNLVVRGGRYSTFISASGVYGRLELTGIEFTSNTASAYANYTDGNSTSITGNTVRTGASPTVVYPWNAAFNDFAGETDPLVSQYTYAAATTASPIINCRKSRGTLQAPGAITANDALCGINFYGYSNGGWRDGGSIQPTATAVSLSNLTGRLTFRLPDAGTSTVMLILNPTNVVVGATDSNSTALLNVNGGQVHIGSGVWPTSSIGQSNNSVLMSQGANQHIILYNSTSTVAADTGGTISLGARQTDATADFQGGRIFGGRVNATSGNGLGYLSLRTTNAGGTFTEAVNINGAQLVTMTSGLTVTGAVTFVSLTSSSTGDYMCWNTGTSAVTQGTAPCTTSSERYKHDIDYRNIPGMRLVRQMKPISFVANAHPEIGAQFGFKAEDVDRIDKRLVYYDEHGQANSFAYMNYTAILTKAMQELDERVRRLEARR